MSAKPRLLDLFSGAGGCARGYQLAGFHVTGVDNRPQQRYIGDAFILGDALEYCAEHGHEYDAVHASPPCQAYSGLRSLHPDRDYPRLIEPTRTVLEASGRPWVIENVEGAPLRSPLRLCGASFGLRVYRHRLFESPLFFLVPRHQRHVEPSSSRGYRGGSWRGFVTVTGGGNTTLAVAKAAMGIDWMTRDELAQAIPPAYCEFIGRQLMAYVRGDERPRLDSLPSRTPDISVCPDRSTGSHPNMDGPSDNASCEHSFQSTYEVSGASSPLTAQPQGVLD